MQSRNRGFAAQRACDETPFAAPENEQPAPRAAQAAPGVNLLNVSYDPTRELYQDFNAAFTKQLKATGGGDLKVGIHNTRSQDTGVRVQRSSDGGLQVIVEQLKGELARDLLAAGLVRQAPQDYELIVMDDCPGRTARGTARRYLEGFGLPDVSPAAAPERLKLAVR